MKVSGRGTSRPAQKNEATSFLTGALATVAEHFGVEIQNIRKEGQPMAIAIIKNARFGEENGETILAHHKESEDEA